MARVVRDRRAVSTFEYGLVAMLAALVVVTLLQSVAPHLAAVAREIGGSL